VAPAPAPAFAADGRISRVVADGGTVEAVFTGTGLEPGTHVDARNVTASLDGRAVRAVAEPVTASLQKVDRTVILVVDTSGSMRGEGIESARAVTRQFVQSLPADVKVGLVAFSSASHRLVDATDDHGRVLRALGKLEARGETALYDALVDALSMAGTRGDRRVLLLSDGGDTVSKQSSETALTRIRDSRVVLDAVGLQTDESSTAALQEVVLAGRGKLQQAGDGAALSGAFSAAARAYATQLLVRVTVPAALSGRQVTLRIEAATADGDIADEARVLLPTLPQAAKPLPSVAKPMPEPAPVAPVSAAAVPLVPPSWMDLAFSLRWSLLSLFVGLVLLLLLAVAARSGGRGTAQMRRVMSPYSLISRPRPKVKQSTALGETAIARNAVEFAGRVVRRRGLEQRFSMKLDRAGIAFKPAEWLVVHALAGFASMVLLVVFGLPPLVTVLLGLLAGWLLPSAYASVKATRRQRAFEDGLPDALQLISGSLSAGYSLPQAVDAVVREGSEPVSGEMGRALAESRLGVAVEDALENVGERLDSNDFRWVVMAIRVQREVGGNLSEVLLTVAGTIRERQQLFRQVRALSAEGRLSAYILTGLPIVMGGFLAAFRTDYVSPLYKTALGLFMLGAAVAMMIIGSLWMRKLVKVEV
jgi:tight adherence protein B